MKPVRLPAAATLALPRWALYALGLLYILPGLIGRDPWKEDAASFGIMWTMAHGGIQDWLLPNIAGLPSPEEGPLAFWLGALCIKLFGWLLGDVLAARMSTIGIFVLGTVSDRVPAGPACRSPATAPGLRRPARTRRLRPHPGRHRRPDLPGLPGPAAAEP
jgi:hypothetical protein